MGMDAVLLQVLKGANGYSGPILIVLFLLGSWFFHWRITKLEKRLCWLEDRLLEVFRQACIITKNTQEIKDARRGRLFPY